MTVFKRNGSNNFMCEFELQGVKVRESTRTSSKTEALAYEVRRRAEVADDIQRKRMGVKKFTMGVLADLWLSASEVNHRDHKNNQSRVRKLFGESLELEGRAWVLRTGTRYGLSRDLGLAELTQEHLTLLKVERLKEKCSPATVNREMSLLQSLVGFATSMSAVLPERPIVWSHKRNKAASLKMSEGGGKLRWLSTDEERALLRSLRDEADKRSDDQSAIDAHDLVMFLLDSGARYAEVAEVRWDQVDLGAGTLNLYRSKTQNESILYLPQRTRSILGSRRERMEELGAAYSYVFPQLKGRSWSGKDKPRGHATAAIQRHIDGAGLNDDQDVRGRVTPHTFRDTFASRLVQAGVSLLKVSKLLGHANVKMTEKYAHLAPDAPGLEAAAILDKLHGANKPTKGDDPIAEAAKATPHKTPHTSNPHSERLTLVLAVNNSQAIDLPGESGEDVGGTCVTRTRDLRIKSPTGAR